MPSGRTTDEEAGLSRSRYLGDGYLSPQRWLSFCAQVDAVRRLSPRTVLEVGIGGGIVSTILRHLGMQVTTTDINPELGPDLVVNLTELAAVVPPESYDVTLCAEVMEHLPLGLFGVCLQNLASVTKDRTVVTLPDVLRGWVTLRGKIWRKHLNLYWGPHSRRVSADHHWQIGSEPATRLEEILTRMCKYFEVETHYRIAGCPAHRLFVLRKAAGSTGPAAAE